MHRHLAPSLIVSFLLVTAACGDDAVGPADSGMTVDSGAADTSVASDTSTPPVDAAGADRVTASTGPFTVPSGTEDTICVVRRLPLDADVFATEVRTHIDPGSHHAIVYRLDTGTPSDEPFPCTPFTDILGGDGLPIVLAQESERMVRYPEGTGLRLSAGQLVRLELHYINTTPDPLEVGANVEFDVTPVTSDVQEIGYIFSGTTAINVPARSTGSATQTYSPPPGIRLFGVTTHMHHWGTVATVTLSGEEIHRSNSWSEPPLDTFDPSIETSAGDTLQVVCEYENGSDTTVHFGESANDEMCFMIALYYPSSGFILHI
jgi:hypothetical protein